MPDFMNETPEVRCRLLQRALDDARAHIEYEIQQHKQLKKELAEARALNGRAAAILQAQKEAEKANSKTWTAPYRLRRTK